MNCNIYAAKLLIDPKIDSSDDLYENGDAFDRLLENLKITDTKPCLASPKFGLFETTDGLAELYVIWGIISDNSHNSNLIWEILSNNSHSSTPANNNVFIPQSLQIAINQSGIFGDIGSAQIYNISYKYFCLYVPKSKKNM